MSGVGRVLYSLELPPIVAVKIRKVRIAGKIGMHNREVDMVSPRQYLAVKTGPADDKHFLIFVCHRQCRLHRSDDDKTFCTEIWVAANHEIDATGQWPAEGLTGASSHDDMVPAGKGAEALEISRQVPGQGVVDANDAVFGDRSDQRDSGYRHAAHGPGKLRS